MSKTKKIRGNRRAAVMVLAGVAIVAGSGCRSLSTGLFEGGRQALRVLADVTAGTVDVDGQQIGYLRRDGAGPPLVLLHGFASEKDVWLRFLRALPGDRQVIALDLPGHGDSTRDENFHYDIEAMVGKIDGAIDQLTTMRFHLIGTSLGGMLASIYAARHPHRVITLTLYAPAGIYPPRPSAFQQALQRGENPLIATEPEQFDKLIEIVFHDPPLLIWPVGAALRDHAMSRAAFNTKIWNDLWPGHPTLDDVLPELVMPVLLVWGREDEVLDVSSVPTFERLLPAVQTVLIDGAGHAIINERPREMAQLHYDFVLRQPCATAASASDDACTKQATPDQAGPASDE